MLAINNKKLYWGIGIGLGVIGIGALVYHHRKKITPALKQADVAIDNAGKQVTKAGKQIAKKVEETGKRVAETMGLWIHPITAKKISSPFGNRVNPVTKKQQYHNGIDLPTAEGTKVKSPMDGVVVDVYDNKLGGNQVIIKHSNGYQTGYAHLSKQLVKKGDKVKKGDIIALSGNTGRSTGPHLHLTLRDSNGKYIDAAKVIYA